MTKFNYYEFSDKNYQRCEKVFHPVNDWSTSDWATAVAGECGEMCNFVKKLRRLEDGTNTGKDPQTKAEIVDNIGKELADMVTYADLLASSLGICLEEYIVSKFNEVSDRMDSDIKIG